MERESKRIHEHRVITMLGRAEMEFLDRMGKDSLFSTGHKLSYSEILKGLVELAMKSGVSGEGIGSISELEEKLMRKIAEDLEKNKTA
ncbi:MAG: hypothetical protein KJ880_05825 [Candidatus Omnitrophica bacterium]|nr:hypothetical protein [Candidatus Omnitrophota bacterium]MBU1870247.1 hypothetical protein [Candidatus Omnitrophota bacterium]